MVAPTVSALLGTVDQGQTSTLSSTGVTTGTGPYTYQWLSKIGAGSYSSISGATSSTYSFVTSGSTTTGVWSFELQVTDSASTHVVVTSSGASVTVNVAPSITVSPTSWTIDMSQSKTFTAAPSGGSGTYSSYAWYVDSALQGGQTASTFSYSPASTGSHSITVTVTDSLGATSPQSTAASVTVHSALVAPTASTSLGTVEQGQTSALSSTAVSTGTSPYTYQWLSEAPGAGSYSSISGATSSSYSFATSSSTATGTWSFELRVTDSAGTPAVVTSAAVSVVVNSGPTVTVSPSSWTMDMGQSKTFTATASAGSGSYTGYQWYVGGVSQSGATSSTFSYSPASTGSHPITVTVTDSLGVTSPLSAAASVTVNSAPSVSVSPTSWSMGVGQSKTFTATASAGSGSYTGYQWYVGGVSQSGATSSTFSYSPASLGSYSITVTVTDSLGATSAQSSAASLTVTSFGLDSSGTGTSSATSGSSITMTSLNCKVGDVIIVLARTHGGSSPITVTAISSTSSQTWHLSRASVSGVSGIGYISESYAVVTGSAVTSITVTFSSTLSSTNAASVLVFSITGANTVNPFDPFSTHSGLPYSASSSSGTPSIGSISTSNGHELIIGLEGDRSTTAATAGTGFTLIEGQVAGTDGSAAAQDEVISSALSGATVSFGSSQSGWAMIVDAVQQAPAPTVIVSPSSWTMDMGQSKTFSATASGGSGTYTSYQWYVDGSAQSGQTASTFSYSPVSSGSHSITVTVTDGNGVTSPQSTAASVTVNSAPTVNVSPSSWTMDAGQSKTFSANPSGGSNSYSSYQWYVGSSMVQNSASSSFAYSPASSGSYSITVTVTDSLGATSAPSSAASVTVNSVLTVSVPSSLTVDVGQSVTYSASVSGGAGGYTYQWYYNGAPVGTSATYSYTATEADYTAGSFTISVTVTDAANNAVTSNTETVAVNPAVASKLVFLGAPPSLGAGATSQPIVVMLEDQYGNLVSAGPDGVTVTLSPSVDWYSDSPGVTQISTVSISGSSFSSIIYFMSNTAGSVSLSASSDGYTAAYASLTVNPASPSQLAFVGVPSSVGAGVTSGGIVVQLQDQYGNAVNAASAITVTLSPSGNWYSDSGGTTPISSNQVTISSGSSSSSSFYFMSTNAGSVSLSASLTVTAAPLDHITISPTGASIVAGGSQVYSAESFDQYNNDLGPVTASYSVNAVPIVGSTVSETKVDSYTVTASFAGVSDVSTTLTVTAAPLDHITISPTGASIVAGGTTFSVNSVAISGASVTETAVGSYTIGASYSGKSASTTLTVTVAALGSIKISPVSPSVVAGVPQAFTAAAFELLSASTVLRSLEPL
ncbi:MAG: PKD domain-containing protein [Candidatus Bathyarchaeia archaeon]